MTSPAQKFRIGTVSVIVWRNAGKELPWYSVQIQRSYKNGDDEWRQTDALGFEDTLVAAKLLDQAHSFIAEAMQSDRKAKKDAAAA
jgi:hypothetical protein